MYDIVRGISLKGALFTTDSSFHFFTKESERMAIVFGKNGSGKSTLARSFLNCDGNINEYGLFSNLIDHNRGVVPYTQQHAESTFIFNENYVHKNVRLQEKGLNAIVMFGKQLDIEEKITNAEIALRKMAEEHQKKEEECAKYDGDSLVTAPLYHRRRIKSRLQGDDSWAGIDCKLRGNRQNTAVTDNVINEISGVIPSKLYGKLKSDFDRQLKIYNQVRNGATKISNSISQIENKIDEDKIIQALTRIIEKPDLTDREKHILEAVISGQQVFYEDVHNQFIDESVTVCPYCLQTVTLEYKSELAASIQKVLSKIVDQHKAELKSLKLIKVTFDKNIYDALNRELVEKCEALVNIVNADIDRYNLLIDRKYDNVYTPVQQVVLGIPEKITTVNLSFSKLEISKDAHNKAIIQKDEIMNSLIKLNKELFRYAIEESLSQYNLLKKQQSETKAELASLTTEKNKSQDELNQLLQQKKNTKIAIEHINKGLQYVFFSPNRLELRAEEDEYRLFSNGCPVKPSDVSCGERNIIALCYFFTQTMDNLDEADMYTRESLLIIDDPVSSFDLENRVGILSYLKFQLQKILLSNPESKVILFSHDLNTVFDIEKTYSEISKKVKKHHSGRVFADYCSWELKDKKLDRFSYNRNEYTMMMESIYRFASGSVDEDEISIGNKMRRVLEAFSTFEYKVGTEEISCDQEILSLLKEQKYMDYFENLMYRLVLNGESHMLDRTRLFEDPMFVATTSRIEKERIAKDILCFLFLLNGKHVKSHLNGIHNAIQDINAWCQRILTA